MLLDAIIHFNVLTILGSGAAFAAVGLVFRRGPSATRDRDNLVYSDGFQGATVATLIVVATAVYYIEDPRTGPLLREQASLITLYCILGCMQQVDRFRRSLKQ